MSKPELSPGAFQHQISNIQKSFQSFDRWTTATAWATEPKLLGLVNEMKSQGQAYWLAVQVSVDCSQTYLSIARDAVNLCDSLPMVQQKRVTASHILACIERLQKSADDVREKALQASSQVIGVFGALYNPKRRRSFRSRLFQRSEKVQRSEKRHLAAQMIAQNLAGFVDEIDRHGVRGGFLLPPLTIAVPFICPLISYWATEVGQQQAYIVDERVKQGRLVNQAIFETTQVTENIQLAKNGLSQSEKTCDIFQYMLDDLKYECMSLNDTTNLDPSSRIHDIRRRWMSACQAYQHYITEVEDLQDLHPYNDVHLMARRKLEDVGCDSKEEHDMVIV